MNEKKTSNNDDFDEISKKINSLRVVQRNGWAIKISSLNDKSFIILFVSQYTKQSIVRYCMSEKEAIETIYVITHKNAREILDLGY